MCSSNNLNQSNLQSSRALFVHCQQDDNMFAEFYPTNISKYSQSATQPQPFPISSMYYDADFLSFRHGESSGAFSSNLFQEGSSTSPFSGGYSQYRQHALDFASDPSAQNFSFGMAPADNYSSPPSFSHQSGWVPIASSSSAHESNVYGQTPVFSADNSSMMPSASASSSTVPSDNSFDPMASNSEEESYLYQRQMQRLCQEVFTVPLMISESPQVTEVADHLLSRPNGANVSNVLFDDNCQTPDQYTPLVRQDEQSYLVSPTTDDTVSAAGRGALTFREVSSASLSARKDDEKSNYHRFRLADFHQLPAELQSTSDVKPSPTTLNRFVQCTPQITDSGKVKFTNTEIPNVPLDDSKESLEESFYLNAFDADGCLDEKNFLRCKWEDCGAIVPRDWPEYKEHLTKFHVPELYFMDEEKLPIGRRGMTLYGVGKKTIIHCRWRENGSTCSHSGQPSSFARHVQSLHLPESITISCPKCGKQMINRSLYQHQKNPNVCRDRSKPKFVDMQAKLSGRSSRKKRGKKSR